MMLPDRPRMLRLAPWLASAALALTLHVSPAAAQLACPARQQPLSIGPAYLDEVDGGRALGAVGSVNLCRPGYDTRRKFPRAHYLGFQADGAVPFRRLSLPQNLRGSAWAGVAVSLTERAEDTLERPLDETPGIRFNYGVLGFGGRAQYEASTDFAEQAAAGGIELRWVHPNWRLAPSTVLTLNAVLPLASEVRDTLRADNEVHGRFGAQLYWLVPVVRWLEVEVDGRYFRGFGMDELVAATGLDEVAYLSGTLVLVPRAGVGPVLLDRLFVGYAAGRQPTDPEERKAWTAGARLTAR